MKKKILGRLLTMLLVAAMVFTLLPASAIAAAEWWGGDEYADDTATQATTTDDFIRVFHLDCGRKYFSVAQIEEFIDLISKQNYTHMELAVGNDGLRFLLDDMSLTVNGKDYTSKQVSDAIHAGNAGYYSSEVYELTEDDMNAIFSYAKEKNIKIIPLLNTPGHMDAILSAATSLTGVNCSYNGSASTINVENTTAVAFTKAVLQKYIDYFAGKGCEYFNMGADEYANDIYTSGSLGFGNLIGAKKYGAYITYVNEVAAMIKAARMKPMAFNDGIYFQSNTSYGTFDTDIIVCYWSAGYGSYNVAPASTLASFGHKILNTHERWYYVLGNNNNSYNYSTATSGVNTVAPTTVNGSSGVTPIGCMQCFWCDTPSYSYNSTEQNRIQTLITTFSNNNPSIFKETTPVEPGIVITPSEGSSTGTTLDSTSGTASVTLDAGEVVTWHWDTSLVNLVSADNTVNAYAVMDSLDARRVTITPVANVSGTAAITAEKAGKTAATYTVKVTDGSEAVEEPVINIAVGEERTITLGANAVLNTNGLEKSIATVTATPNKVDGKTEVVRNDERTEIGSGSAPGVISDGNGNYLVINGSSISNTTEIAKATTFTVKFKNGSGYTIYGNGRYLSRSLWNLSTDTQSFTWKYSSDKGFYSTGEISSNDYYLNYNNDWVVTTGSGNGFLYGTHEETTGAVDQTLITFKGVAAGTTYVTIDGVKYTINVSDKAPSGAMTSTSIDLEYWITNYEVYDGTSTNTNHTKSITTSTTGATSDEGIEIATIAPNKAYSFFDGTKAVYYWQAMRLDADNQQTNASGDDETADGTTLTHIRYHGGAWQYKTADGIWNYFQSTDQLVAYYLQKTEVTKEIDTYVKDWGYTTDGTTPDTSSSKGQVALTVAVVYPDGTVSPDEGSMYANSTSIFNYWDSRDIGIVAPTNNSDYTISKITVTDGKRDSNSSANVWYTSDSIAWEKKDLEDGTSKWYDETVVWDKDTNAGTTPMVNGKVSNITWSAKNTAKLVLIYLETVQKETNLNVVYYNDNDKENIASMQVAMTYNQGDTEPTYANSLYLYGTVNADGTVTDGTLIAENKSSWSSNVVGDAEYLPDAAYVVNAANKAQTFSKTLSTIPGVAAKYKSGVYQYISADISSDGKTLTLHYAINASKLDKKYIFDFGLPIEIPLSELVDNYDDIEYLSVDGTNLFENSVKTAHGTLSYDSSSKSIVFTLNKTVDTQAPLTGSFRVKYTNVTELSKAITIALIPASNVLYEESFLNSADGWTKGTSAAPTTAQETQKVGDTTGTTYNVFGYDNAYKTKTGASGYYQASGLEAGKGLSSALTTEFYGNGFDLIGNCGPTTGRVFMLITNNGDGKGRIVDVDTRYNGETLYQVPLAHVELSDAHYTVKIYAGGLTATTTSSQSGSRNAAVYASSFAVNGYDVDLNRVLAENGLTLADVEYTKISSASTVSAVSAYSVAAYADTASTVEHQKGTHVEIDGFRVYRSTTDDVAKNYPENEQNVKYVNILDAADNFTAFVEGSDKDTEWTKADEYELKGGPQNEIYLRTSGTGNGSAVTFKTNVGAVLQISARAVENGKNAKLVINSTTYDIASNTEMYYTVTANEKGIVTIKNTGTGMLALGNLKVKDGTTVQALSEEDYPAAIALLNETVTPTEPEQPTVFVPEHFSIRNYATPLFRHKLVTLRIDFSKDVSYVEIDGQKYYPSKFASWFGYYTVTFTDTIGRNDNYFYKVVFFDANGNPSETLSVYGK